jgi:hypothetical protein
MASLHEEDPFGFDTIREESKYFVVVALSPWTGVEQQTTKTRERTTASFVISTPADTSRRIQL